MLICRVRSIVTDESGKKPMSNRWQKIQGIVCVYFKRPLNDLEETSGGTVDATILFQMLNKALFERKLVGH